MVVSNKNDKTAKIDKQFLLSLGLLMQSKI